MGDVFALQDEITSKISGTCGEVDSGFPTASFFPILQFSTASGLLPDRGANTAEVPQGGL
jgi:hypothetical protein